MNAKLVLVSLLGLAAFGNPTDALAQYRVFGCPYYAVAWNRPPTYYSEPLPYFALHPPVYYGYLYAPTYCHNRAISRSETLARKAAQPQPLLVRNIYVTPCGDQLKSQQARLPLRIVNPFVTQPGSSDAANSANQAKRQPQIIYPASLAQRDRENPPNCGKPL